MNGKKENSVMKSITDLLAQTAFKTAKLSVKSACYGPFFEPKQPKNLTKLK